MALTMTLLQFTEFLGWCTLINVAFLIVSFLFLTVFRQSILKLHVDLFALSVDQIKPLYLRILGQYKILIIVFNLVPYLVLKFLL